MKRYRLRIRRDLQPVKVIALGWPGLAILRAHLAFLGGMFLQSGVSARVIDVCEQRVVCALTFSPEGMPDGRYCRSCGCSDLDACEDGCWWVEDDLCSVCSPIRFMGF